MRYRCPILNVLLRFWASKRVGYSVVKGLRENIAYLGGLTYFAIYLTQLVDLLLLYWNTEQMLQHHFLSRRYTPHQRIFSLHSVKKKQKIHETGC